MYCSRCEELIFQRPAPTAWAVVHGEEEAVFVTTDPPSSRRTWTVPGGFIEVDESAREAAARELEEETTLRVDPESFRLIRTGFHMDDPEDGSLLSVCFAVERSGADGELAPRNEIVEARWCDLGWFERNNEALQTVDRCRYETALSDEKGAAREQS